MTYGPIELVVIGFPHNRFRGDIVLELSKLVDQGIIRIVDILLIRKDKHGKLSVQELTELKGDDFDVFSTLVSDLTGMLTKEDAEKLSAKLKNDTAAAIMMFENTWAKELVQAIDDRGGTVVFNERIPRRVIEEITHEKVAA